MPSSSMQGQGQGIFSQLQDYPARNLANHGYGFNVLSLTKCCTGNAIMKQNKLNVTGTSFASISILLLSFHATSHSEPDAEYIQGMFKSHTKAINSLDDPHEFPESHKMRTAFDSVVERFRTLPESDRQIIDETSLYTANGAFQYHRAVKGRAEKTLERLCQVMYQQEAEGQQDVRPLVKLGSLADRQEEEDAQAYYLGIKHRLSAEAQKIFEENMRPQELDRRAVYTVTDFAAVAEEAPEIIYAMYKNGCERRKKAAKLTIDDFAPTNRYKEMIIKEENQ